MKDTKIKLLYTEDGRMLYSKFFPEIPEIKASIYHDIAVMKRYENDLKRAIEQAVEVINPDKAKFIIIGNEPLERDKIYDVECSFKFVNSKLLIL